MVCLWNKLKVRMKWKFNVIEKELQFRKVHILFQCGLAY